MKKAASKEVHWTEDELEKLLDKISVENKKAGSARDHTGYHVSYKDNTVAVDLEKLPKEYKKVFDDLKDDLQIVPHS